MDTNKIIHLAAKAGKLMLENGGETYRVEETIDRICNAYGLHEAESFVTTTGIMLSVTDRYGQTTSIVRRIKVRKVDLEKVSRLNDLSRNIKARGLTSDEVFNELHRIDEIKKYSTGTIVTFSSLGAAFFTLLFGGNIYDFIISFFVGGIIKWCSIKLANINVNEFFINTLGGAMAATLAIIAVHFKLGFHVDKIIIGSIMLLVPGLAITNAIRDTISGDLLAGISRAVEAFLIAIAIAVGSGIVLRLWYIYYGGI
jgi:uncharacterized membrane protein YjjP (DUF1212 family)